MEPEQWWQPAPHLYLPPLAQQLHKQCVGDVSPYSCRGAARWFNRVSTYDYPLHMLNAARGKIYYDKRPMAVYRQHSHAIWSQAGTIKKLEMARGVRELMINHFKDSGNIEAVEGLLPAYRAVCIAMIKADSDNRATYNNHLKRFYPDINDEDIDNLVTAPQAGKALSSSC